jgi:hypothetical protein
MTFEYIDTAKNDTLMIICTEPAQANLSLKLRVQPWLKMLLASVCLTQGLRFLYSADSIGVLIGLCLLICVPSCCYLGWRDYRGIKEAKEGGATRRSAELRKIVR